MLSALSDSFKVQAQIVNILRHSSIVGQLIDRLARRQLNDMNAGRSTVDEQRLQFVARLVLRVVNHLAQTSTGARPITRSRCRCRRWRRRLLATQRWCRNQRTVTRLNTAMLRWVCRTGEQGCWLFRRFGFLFDAGRLAARTVLPAPVLPALFLVQFAMLLGALVDRCRGCRPAIIDVASGDIADFLLQLRFEGGHDFHLQIV